MAKRKKATKRKKKVEEKRELSEIVDLSLDSETKRGILVVFLFALALISLLSLVGIAGSFGGYVDTVLGIFFGWMRFVFPLLLLVFGYLLMNPDRYEIKPLNTVGTILFVVSVNSIIHLLFDVVDAPAAALAGMGGGYLGLLLSYPLQLVMGFWATLIILLAILLVGLLIAFDTNLEDMAEQGNIWRRFMNRMKVFGMHFKYSGEEGDDEYDEEHEGDYEEGDEEEEEGEYEDEEVPEPSPTTEAPAITLKPSNLKIDIPLGLLNSPAGKPTSGDIKDNMNVIQKTLEQFGIPVTMGEVSVGPTVTQFTFKPAEGVKLSKITNLSNDLALALAAHPIRIEAPIPGKSLVGIEVPNQKASKVVLKEVLDSSEFKKRVSKLTMALGKDVSGQAWTADLAKMPHMLVAGATGSGKSVCLNTIIVSLLYQNNPDDLRFIFVDPKRVELTVYNDIPHLLTPVITKVPAAVNALKWAIGEMDRRFDLLAKRKKRDIDSYNKTAGPNKLPKIVIIIDELADLMVSASSDVEGGIIRLAQMARAIGIHLIVATQRPSVDVITGLIKANIPGRVAFSVASLMDSRTILDTGGAEKLIGRGDMLMVSADIAKPKRLQGAFVSDDEIKKVTDYIKEQGDPQYIDDVVKKQVMGANSGGGEPVNEDPLFEDAIQEILQASKASASFLQRRLKVGYARAARLLDMLEEQGVIGPGEGAKPREILISSYEELGDHEPMVVMEDTTVEDGAATGDEEEEDQDFEVADDDKDLEEGEEEEGEEEEEEEEDEVEEKREE